MKENQLEALPGAICTNVGWDHSCGMAPASAMVNRSRSLAEDGRARLPE